MASPLISVTVFCGSNRGIRPAYSSAAAELGREIASRSLRLVYGGTNVGTMGILADAALEAGGTVTGIIPQAIADRGIRHPGLSELIVVPDMHERKHRMAQMGDAFVALPGGFGTLEEFLEAVTWNQLGIHHKPCGLLNVSGFYDGFMDFFRHAVAEGFVPEQHADAVVVDAAPDALLDRLASADAHFVPKWMAP